MTSKKQVKIVRTKTRADGPLTPEEEAKLKVHIAMWLDRARRTTPIDREKAAKAIVDLYAVAEPKPLPPPEVAFAISPMSMAFAFGATRVLRKKGDKRPVQEIVDAIEAHTVGDTPQKRYANACRSIAGKAGIDATLEWWKNYQAGNLWAGLVCYVSAARDILGLDLPSFKKFVAWENAAIEGHFRVLEEEWAILSDFPVEMHLTDEMRLHNPKGDAMRYRDGWGFARWNDTPIPRKWVNGEPPTPKEALTWENIEQRRVACEIVGWAKVLQELNAKVIDADEDPMVGTLVEVDLPVNAEQGSTKERFLRVLCGTGREFALPVPRNMKTALEANAWTYGFDTKDFLKPEVRT